FMSGADQSKIARLPRAFVPDLTAATSRTRLEAAERAQAAEELRKREIARLEQMRDALAAFFAQTGLHADAFDPEFVAEARPRLRIDRAAFIDCGEDRGHYRLIEI